MIMAKAKQQVEIEEPVFSVPSLADVDADYAALVERHKKVTIELAANAREQQSLQADLQKNRKGPSLRPAVGELIGDVMDIELDERPKQLAELRKRAHDLEDAEQILNTRIRERKGVASIAVCNAVKPEYGARVKAFAEALEFAHKARVHLEDMILDLEANDVSWTRLGVFRTPWLGGINDGHVQRFVREAKEQGYL